MLASNKDTVGGQAEVRLVAMCGTEIQMVSFWCLLGPRHGHHEVTLALDFVVTEANNLLCPSSLELSPMIQRDKEGSSHLEVVGCDDGNVTRLDPRIHQGLDVQSDEADFTWGGGMTVVSEGRTMQPLFLSCRKHFLPVVSRSYAGPRAGSILGGDQLTRGLQADRRAPQDPDPAD